MQPSMALRTIDRLPLLPLGRVDGGEDQVVLVEERRAGLVAGRVGRVEGELGEEALARGIAGGDLLELEEVVPADDGVVVDALEVRLVPEAHALQVGRPAGLRRRAGPRPARRTPASRAAARAGGAIACERRRRRRRRRRAGRGNRPRSTGRCPAASCSTRKPATRSRGFSAKRSTASTSLTWAASRNLSPPNLTKGMLRRVSSISSGPL